MRRPARQSTSWAAAGTTGSLPNAASWLPGGATALYTIDIGATDDGTALLQLLADETGGAYFAAAGGLGSLFAAVDAGERTLTREYRVDIAAGSAVVSGAGVGRTVLRGRFAGDDHGQGDLCR
ncbi:MAG: hypothetical protein R3A10_00390 [Caldilineaceae bacterium]